MSRLVWRGGAGLLAVGLLLLVGGAGWAAFASFPPETREIRYLIPPGTAQRLRAGEKLDLVPPMIRLTVGVRDVLVITNDDDVLHQVGPIILGPQQVYRIPFRRPGSFQYACTLHSSGRLTIAVDAEPSAGLARLRWRIDDSWGRRS